MNAGDTLRLFFALWPDDGTRKAFARCRDAWAWDTEARPEPTGRLHLTLHFLGDVPQRRLPELMDGLQVPSRQFTLCLGQTRWPNGVAVLMPENIPQALLALHAALQDRLDRLNFVTETRRYRPHVTLARRVDDLAVPSETSPVRWPIHGYALVQSHPWPRDYVVLRCFR